MSPFRPPNQWARLIRRLCKPSGYLVLLFLLIGSKKILQPAPPRCPPHTGRNILMEHFTLKARAPLLNPGQLDREEAIMVMCLFLTASVPRTFVSPSVLAFESFVLLEMGYILASRAPRAKALAFTLRLAMPRFPLEDTRYSRSDWARRLRPRRKSFS